MLQVYIQGSVPRLKKASLHISRPCVGEIAYSVTTSSLNRPSESHSPRRFPNGLTFRRPMRSKSRNSCADDLSLVSPISV